MSRLLHVGVAVCLAGCGGYDVTVTAPTDGARVLVDGVEDSACDAGESPCTVSLADGDHEIELSQEGWLFAPKTVSGPASLDWAGNPDEDIWWKGEYGPAIDGVYKRGDEELEFLSVVEEGGVGVARHQQLRSRVEEHQP